ncbi:hypothetical protein JUN65_02080 [Gluconacetobacter azotocaptans]|uniref:hypothetical protein n=1 Tax=Gluconacetobacter azotocaptans TaxID=142834 RepID=UPI00195EBA86|nr:hypothetical protein [Gluconacetobacter azotocaptans]MBM9400382.1 hypothetical protein [Gluconacetobacter azotocaptans]
MTHSPFTVSHADGVAPAENRDAFASSEAPPGYEDAVLPKGAHWLRDGRVFLQLGRPVIQTFANAGGQTEKVTDHLIFRELLGEDIFEAGTLPRAAQMRDLACRSMGNVGPVGDSLLRKMPARDISRIMEIVMVFTGTGQTTGQ